VTHSYDFPIETYAVNVVGTAHVLESIRFCDSVRSALIVTTDKCYENREWIHPYRETDRLGGVDPYSSSKACAEHVTTAYRASYFSSAQTCVLASARAGNVIGGGDWAAHRLIPDCIKAYSAAKPMTIRNPHAVRPWQYVFESLYGYILLAEHLLGENGSQFAEAWNFGPEMEDMQSVGEVAAKICRLFNVPISLPSNESPPPRHEAALLRLDSTKAKARLNWAPRWRLQKSIDETAAWYHHYMNGGDMLNFSRMQIERYLNE
jgi:CDP-glucose 4,6-dehydratase